MPEKKDDFSLKFGYWLAIHRDQLRTWWVSMILAVAALCLAYFFVVFVSFSFSSSRIVHGIRLMAQPLVAPLLRQTLSPKPLVAEQVTAIARDGGRYDLVAKVSNANKTWAAVSVTFHFTNGTTETKNERTTIWPSSDGYLLQTNVGLSAPPQGSSYSVAITDVAWRRPKDLALYNGISFPVSDVSIVPITGLASGAAATRLSATVENKSVYSFRSIRFIIVVKIGDSIAAVNDVIVEKMKPLEKRPVEVTWLTTVQASSDVIFVPVLDLQNQESFL